MSSSYPLIRRYPGNCVMFNMMKSSRVKKQQLKNKQDGAVIGTTNIDELLSEEWMNEDEDNYLIIRLIYHKESYPWLVCHHGIHEIFKGPLYVPIVDQNNDQLSLHLRDFANRGEDCIKRKFYLTFGSITEAESFKYIHNSMLSAFNDGQKAKRVELDLKKKKNQKNEKDDDEMDADAVVKATEEDAATTNQRLKKKRRISMISQELDTEVMIKEDSEEKKNQGCDAGDDDDYKKRLNEFEFGSDHHTFLDDSLPNTQNPFEDDESY
jgi:hypothetical protein